MEDNIIKDNTINILLPETTKTLKIDGKEFLFETDSIELLHQIEKTQEQVKNIQASKIPETDKLKEIVNKCKDGIDLALGSGAFTTLFGDTKDSYLRPLYLLSQLVGTCRQATKDVMLVDYSSERAKNRE